MIGLRRCLLLLLALTFFAGAQARAEDLSAPFPLDPKVKTEMKELQAKIKADRAFLKGEREKLKPVVDRLKANNAKMRDLREKVKAKRDAVRATQGTNVDKKASGSAEDDPFDDILAPQ